jgi:hypothetical protein
MADTQRCLKLHETPAQCQRESPNKLYASPRYARAELKREGDLWRDLDEFIALFSKAKHGDPYRVEFRLVERLI